MEIRTAPKTPPGLPEVKLERPIKVLLIEDNPLDVRLIAIMMRDSGGGLVQLEPVERLDTGLKRLDQGGIDVVLVDLSLPDSHGLETFERVHAHAPKVPIIVLSGMSDET